jgi:hypothetical protein
MRRPGSRPHQRLLAEVSTPIARARAAIARFGGCIALVIAALFLAGWPATQTEAATQHICSGTLCIDIQELPDTRLALGPSFNRAVKFVAVTGEYGGHYNVRTKGGDQVEICGQCAWTFYAKPGKSYTFSVQGCSGGNGPRSLFAQYDCGAWNIFRYKTDQPLQVIVVQSPPASPQVVPLPGKGKKNAGDYALKEIEALPGKGKKDAGDYVLKDSPGGQGADLTVVSLKGPGNLQPGLSGTYTFTIQNVGTVSATVELAILFAKALDQTGQIIPGVGLSCTLVSHAAAINAQVNCTGGQLGAGETGTVTVQARGQLAGGGMLIGSLNNSRSLVESNYNNNLKQLNVTIN